MGCCHQIGLFFSCHPLPHVLLISLISLKSMRSGAGALVVRFWQSAALPWLNQFAIKISSEAMISRPCASTARFPAYGFRIQVSFTNMLTLCSSGQHRASQHEIQNESRPGPAFVLGTYPAHPGPAEWNISVSHVVGGCGWVCAHRVVLNMF